MRYSLYVDLFKLCNSFSDALRFIESSQNENMCTQLLSDCMQVLDVLETALYRNEDSVCEKGLFDTLASCKKQCAGLMGAVGNGMPNRQATAKLRKSAIALISLFQDGIKVTHRVVFFAELGQKWDSMNSVYEAFRNRSDCEVDVVLTPIFREVGSGSALRRDVIYEDYLTPMGIKYIPYQQYDISKSLPDIAFISNPYESVTLPQFWPQNIASHTKLVYLPYYTNIVANQENLKSRCLMPVAQCAWKIIEQSQRMKDLYAKYAKNHGTNVLVTGLPKWDAVTGQCAVEIPTTWKDKFDGRTVFLWNSYFKLSSYSTLLEYGEPIVKFFEERDDVALIWRPHPMTETMFRLYYPQYRLQWENLKAIVEKSGNMVLDQNPSYDAAFQCSDALISDFSSMIPQYMLTEKPVLYIEKDRMLEKIERESVSMLVDIHCLERASSIPDIFAFIDRIGQGIDVNKDNRLRAVRRDMPNADGHIGERVCELLLAEMYREDMMIS